MINRTLLRKIVRDLFARKASLAALIFIMGFGISALIGFWAVYRDLERATHKYMADYRLPEFIVSLKRAPMEVLEEVRRLPNVELARGRVFISANIQLPGVDEPITGMAISMPESRVPVLNDVMMISGTWFTGDDPEEAIVNDAFAKANGLRVGDRLRVLLQDEQRDVLIVGTAISPEFIYLIPPSGGLAPDPARFGSFYMPERFLQEASDLDGAFNQIIGTFRDDATGAQQATLAALRDGLDEYGVTLTGLAKDEPSTQFILNEIENVKKSSVITPVIFLSVAALMLNVLVARLVAHQRGVIGTLKAIGYSPAQIVRHYLGYGITLGVAGGALGAGLGHLIHIAMLSLYRTIFSLPEITFHGQYHLFLYGILISAAAACLGTIKGVRQAAKLEPAAAMHPPPPERGRAILLERLPWLWRRLPFRAKLVLRDIFRNPFRSAVSIFVGMVATVLMIGALAMRDGMYFLTSYEYTKVSHMDLTINLRDPLRFGYPAEVREIPGVAEIENLLVVPADLTNGARVKRVGINGVERGSKLYTPKDNAGNLVQMPSHGVVLARKLAEILDVQAGDEIFMQPLLGERRRVAVRVSAIVDTYVGLSAYADLEFLSSLIGEEWAGNAMMVKLNPGASKGPLLAAMKERPVVTGASDRLRSMRQFDETFSKANGVIIGVFVIFAGLIGFGSVLNASLVSLSERQREVGTLRVIGYTSRQIATIFALESFILYGVGTLIGLWAARYYVIFLAYTYSSEIFRFPVVVNTDKVIGSLIAMLVLIAIAQVIVYRLIDRLEWLEVLKVKE